MTFKWNIQNPLIPSLIGLVGVIVGGFLTSVVWPILRPFCEHAWDKMSSRMFGKRNDNLYLDWVINEHRYLPALPSTLVPLNMQGEQSELDRLYVALRVRSGTAQKEAQIGDLLSENSKLVVIGDPGAGKTTTLRFLALTFARARRNRPGAVQARQHNKQQESGRQTRERVLKEKESIKQARKMVQEEFGLTSFPLPVFVYLNRFRNLTEWAAGYSLLDAIQDELRTVNALRDLPRDFFSNKLKRGECIFLLDAFDELATDVARQAVARAVGELTNSAAYGNRFIVSSRIVGYRGQLRQYGFPEAEIQHLTWPLIEALVESWGDSLGKRGLVAPLLSTIKANHRILELAANPMLLSLIVLVQYARGVIPDRRHVLYNECVNILIERRFATLEVRESFSKVVPDEEAIHVLRLIAGAMHDQHLREIRLDKLEDGVIPAIQARMGTSSVSVLKPSLVFHNIQDRSQLLVERGLDESGESLVAFSHLTFQEFLAASALKTQTAIAGEAVVSDELIRKYLADPEWWEEVALLYGAQLEHATDFLERLYPRPHSLEVNDAAAGEMA
jgi:predicted NACHT family NTPase